MRRSSRVFLNTALSVLQVAVNGGLYLVLYRYLYDTIGVEQLGIWSIVLAWTSVSNMASLGLGASTSYYVPKYLARGERTYVQDIVQTGTVTGAGTIGLGLLLFYPFVRMILGAIIQNDALLPLALSIVPYAFGSLWLSATAGLVYAGIDGFQRVDLRNIILMVGAAVFLAGAFILVPTRGLVGLAQAQLLQASTVLVTSWLVLRRLLPELPAVPYRWSRRAFSEIIGYSLRNQAVTITLLLFEPLTKSLLARFGSVSAAGYFEMANKLAVQLRAFIVTAHTAVVPTLTDISVKSPDLLRGIYELSCRLVTFLLLALLPMLVAFTPLISVLWLGAYQPLFVLFATLLFVGWFGTLVGNPSYFGYLGVGDLRWIFRSHLTTGVLNGVLGAVGGLLFGGTGVVVGFVIALLAGSLMVTVAYSAEHAHGFKTWVVPENLLLATATLCGMGAVLLLYYRWGPHLELTELIVASLAVYALFVAVPLWLHSACRQLQSWTIQVVTSARTRHA